MSSQKVALSAAPSLQYIKPAGVSSPSTAPWVPGAWMTAMAVLTGGWAGPVQGHGAALMHQDPSHCSSSVPPSPPPRHPPTPTHHSPPGAGSDQLATTAAVADMLDKLERGGEAEVVRMAERHDGWTKVWE